VARELVIVAGLEDTEFDGVVIGDEDPSFEME
jgi:hypothetical protein